MTRAELIAMAEASITDARAVSPHAFDPTVARATALVADGLAAVGVDYLTYRMHGLERGGDRTPRSLAQGLAKAGLLKAVA